MNLYPIQQRMPNFEPNVRGQSKLDIWLIGSGPPLCLIIIALPSAFGDAKGGYGYRRRRRRNRAYR